MKVYILMDCPYYDPSHVLAVYADHAMAKRRMAKLRRQASNWLERQERLESEGSEQAWESNAPHYYDDLIVVSMNMIGVKPTVNDAKGERR